MCVYNFGQMFAFFCQIKTLEIANIHVHLDEIFWKINAIKSLTVRIYKPSTLQIDKFLESTRLSMYIFTVK